jgi:hypothetical protein
MTWKPFEMKLIVIEEHRSNYPNPIFFRKGEILVVGEKDPDYPGWIRVTTRGNYQGWAPIQYLEFEDENKAIAIQDYTAFELNTCIGDELILHFELNDWGWVENKDGSCGWVPIKTTRVV